VRLRPEIPFGLVDAGGARRWWLRYFALMLSAGPLAAVLGAVTAYATHDAAFLPPLLAWTAIFLLGANLAGAALLYRPLHRHLAAGEIETRRLERSLRWLPARSGVWVAALTAAAITGYAVTSHGDWARLTGDSWRASVPALLHVAVFAAYVGLFAYLLVLDCAMRLRGLLWTHGVALRAGASRFALRLAIVVGAVALGPVLIVVGDELDVSASSPGMATGGSVGGMGPGMMSTMSADQMGPHMRYMKQSRHMDLLAALAVAALLAFLATRGLSRSAAALLDAMDRVDKGDLAAEAPVTSDDEFGRLAERFNRMLEGLRERERLRRTFARFVPESVAASLAADEGAIAPQEREASVLFTDIERFTQLTVALGPREILVLLNEYFEHLAEIIYRRGGIITQFQGDAVLACFNLPAADPLHARHALDAAHEIERALGSLSFGPGVRIRTRIGIATGQVVGGTVGGTEHLGYTVHGDTVNLAARLEELNKELGTTVLVSARTAELLGGTANLVDRGARAVRGFPAPLRLFEPRWSDLAPGPAPEREIERKLARAVHERHQQ
jgi:class 3 adenylate cyclase